VAFVAAGPTTRRLFVRALDSALPRLLEGTDGASAPFWSPDGNWVAFFAQGKLKKIPVTGGEAVSICDAADNTGGMGGSWGSTGTIVFALPGSARAGLMRVSASGGAPERLTNPDPKQGGGHGNPFVTDDGRTVVFTTRTTSVQVAASIVARSLVTGEEHTITEGSGGAVITPTHHLLFTKGSTLLAAPLDPTGLRLTGAPVPIEEDLRQGRFDVSSTGLLVYVKQPANEGRSLVWVDRNGVVERASSEVQGYVRPRLSPDGQRVAVDVRQGSKSDIWIYRFDNGTFTRLTTEGKSDGPVWTPDSTRVIFRRGGIYSQAADGSGTADLLLGYDEPLLKSGNGLAGGSWTPDGTRFAFVVHTSTSNGADIWLLDRAPARTLKPIVQRPGDQWGTRVSPDGHWLSYASNESGRFEIYVEPLEGGPKYLVSTDGGREAVWSPAGNELFYRVSDRMMAATIRPASTFATERPHMLFAGQYVSTDLPAYDVSRDGKRFLMSQLGAEEISPPTLSVVENWFEELKRKVPAR